MGSGHVTRFWALTHAIDRESSMACDLFNTEGGLEVRCHCGDTVLHAQRVASMADAMNLCEGWKATYRSQGWIEPPE